ncbi:MAG: hypothetical protein LUC43_03370, partial [Burkholderiales bacterium]|nr:hypothetical protein [Burkholderiales bacterium]
NIPTICNPFVLFNDKGDNERHLMEVIVLTFEELQEARHSPEKYGFSFIANLGLWNGYHVYRTYPLKDPEDVDLQYLPMCTCEDIVLVKDGQVVEGKPSTQEELVQILKGFPPELDQRHINGEVRNSTMKIKLNPWPYEEIKQLYKTWPKKRYNNDDYIKLLKKYLKRFGKMPEYTNQDETAQIAEFCLETDRPQGDSPKQTAANWDKIKGQTPVN